MQHKRETRKSYEQSVDSTSITSKNRKALGCDSIANELLKYGGTYLVNHIIDNHKILREWKTRITMPVFKKEPRRNHGITLLILSRYNTKVIEKIILQKLYTYLNVNENQQGFCPNWSTMDTIHSSSESHKVG